jgi:hypothetical protein
MRDSAGMLCCLTRLVLAVASRCSSLLCVYDKVALASVFRIIAKDETVELAQPVELLAASKPLHRPTNLECSQPTGWLVVNGP